MVEELRVVKRQEVYPDCRDRRLKFFLTDFRDKLTLECVCRRHGGRVAFYFVNGNWRVTPYVERREALVSELLKRALRAAGSPNGGLPDDPVFMEACPAVWEFLTVTEIDLVDLKQKRQTSTLSLFVQDGMWKVFLNDRETQRCVCVAARSLAALWDTLEACLTSDEVPWRAMTAMGGTTRQKGGRKGP